MPSNPLFSIIVPVYNVENYLREAIDSVLQQRFSNYELILVDDGSTDSSLNICLAYAKKHPQISIIHIANTTRGISQARNLGMQIAKGEYVMFLDSDDYWLGDNILSDLADIVVQEKVDLILHNYQTTQPPFISNERDFSGLSGNYKKDFSLLCKRNIYLSSAWTKIVKRSLVVENTLAFPKNLLHEDSAWSFDLALNAKNYKIYNHNFYMYRVRAGSICTSSSLNNILDFSKIIERNFYKLGDIKLNQFELYEGAFNYLAREMQWLREWVAPLNSEQRNQVQAGFDKCQSLFKLFERDFIVHN